MIPFITIGITCFNAEDTIGRAIASAQSQSWGNFEIVIVDDCSSDSSYEKILFLASLDGRIKTIRHNVNKGFPSALNTIIENANGTYIAFFDDDDVSSVSRIEAQYRRFLSYEKDYPDAPLFCYSNRNIVKAGQTHISHTAKAIGRMGKPPHGNIVADFIFLQTGSKKFSWGLFGSCTLFIKKATLLEFEGFDESFRRSAEWDLAIRAAFKGAYFIAVDEALITQYKTPTIDKAGRAPLDYRLKLVEKYKLYLKSKHMYKAAYFLAFSHFYTNKRFNMIASYYRLLAYISSPFHYLPMQLKIILFRS